MILGGSFNPVHLGHVALAEWLSRVPEIAQTLIIPAAQNPLKGIGGLLPNALRRDMARAALGHVPRTVVLDLEMRRPPPSYSIDTLRSLQTLYPAAAFEFALGWDAFCDLPRWRAAHAFLERASVLVVPRAGLADLDTPPQGMLTHLPQGWGERLSSRNGGTWVDPSGRVVLRYVSVKLPLVSGTSILANRTWEWVPGAARSLLLEHLGITLR